MMPVTEAANPALSISIAPAEEAILWSPRLPRVLLAALVGGGLAVVGATFQSMFRNSLADSGLLRVGESTQPLYTFEERP